MIIPTGTAVAEERKAISLTRAGWDQGVAIMLDRTVDAVVAAMEANHLHLMTQKTPYVEISWPRSLPNWWPMNGTRRTSGWKPPPPSISPRWRRSIPN